MSECKVPSSDSFQEKDLQFQHLSEKRQNDQAGNFIRGYSSMVFQKKGKDKRKQGRNNPCNLPMNFKENEKKSAVVVAKKCEVLGFEEVSNEFTCASSIMESYSLNTNKEAKFSFRKLDDGTFALETKNPHDLNSENRESGAKRPSKTRHKKGRYSHKPLKICFKKRSKALRKSSDSNDDQKLEQNTSVQEDITCVKKLDECPSQDQRTGKSWATFRSLVTHRRKLHTSLKGQTQLSSGHLEANPSSSCFQSVSKSGRFSNLKIPCMNFSRAKRSTKITGPSEECLCAASSSEACREQSDCERSDKALAEKYKLQRSLDGENNKKGSSLDMCSEKSPICKRNLEQKPENNEPQFTPDPVNELDVAIEVNSEEESKSDYTLTTSISLSQSPNEKEGIFYKHTQHMQSGPKANENTSHYDNKIHIIVALEGDDTNPLTECERGLDELSFFNNDPPTADPAPDLYEILLMSTATSLVSKVIQSSIQQLVEEQALINRSQSKDSERFYL